MTIMIHYTLCTDVVADCNHCKLHMLAAISTSVCPSQFVNVTSGQLEWNLEKKQTRVDD